MTLTIRRATLEDKPAIFAFLDEVYGLEARNKYPERWEWQFEHNPYKPDHKMPVYITVNENGKVVAQSAAVFEPLQIEGKRQEFAWGVDAFVLEAYRGRNLGLETVRFNTDHHPFWMVMIMATSSRYILTKLGCKDIDPVIVYQKMIHIDNKSINQAAINRLGKFQWVIPLISVVEKVRLDSLLAGFIDVFLSFRDKIRLPIIKPTISIKKKEHFDLEFDEYWEQVKSFYPVSIVRDSDFLRWKFELQPGLHYQTFASYRNGEMSGYMILRSGTEQDNTGIIADLLTFPGDTDTLNALVKFAVQYFRDEKMKYISAASTLPCHHNVFTTMGFKMYKKIIPLVHLDESLAQEYDKIFIPNMWYLGRSDHDWDQPILG